MSSYLTRSFLRSNASFCYCNGNALKASVSHIRDEVFTLDSGLGSPRICTQEELTGIRTNQNPDKIRSDQKVGYMSKAPREKLLNKRILERMFVDLVAGDAKSKARTVARFRASIGDASDVIPGEPHILLPRVYRQNRAWTELNKIWRTRSTVKGLIVDKVKGGYAVAVAGFVSFLPFRKLNHNQMVKDRFTIESMNPNKINRRNSIVLF